jgi:DNA-binding CsgD family transcriptional regulator
MKLVERDGELGVLTGAFVGSAEFGGSVVVVSGAPTTGKTALLHAFSEKIIKSGGVFLGATASRAERGQSLGVMSQLFHGIDLSTEVSDRVTQLLEDGAFMATMRKSDSEAPGSVPVHVLRGLCKVILDLAERGRVVVGIDDVHHADASSLECLLYLARRIRTARMLMILNEGSQLRQEHPQLRVELFRQPHCQEIRLGLLSLDGITRILDDALGSEAAERLAPGCHRLSGGNPLLLQALLEDHRFSAHAGMGGPIPGDAFGQAVSSCLYRCDHDALSVAKALVVLGDQASPPVIGELLDVDVETVGQAINALTAVGLLKASRFRHDAARLAILDTMLASERAAMHCRAAQVGHDHGASATVLAQHVIAANGIKTPWVVPVLEEAAEQELEQGEIGRATDCLRRAYDISTDAQQRAGIKAALARAEWRVAPIAAARHLPELSKHAREGRLRWPDVAAVNGYLLWHGQFKEAVDLLDAVERQSGADGASDAETTAGIDTARFWVCCLFPEHLGDVHPDWSVPVPGDTVSVRALGQLRAAGVLTDVLTGGTDDDTLIGAEQVLQSALRDSRSMAAIMPAIAALVYANKLDKASFWCDALLSDGSRRYAPMRQALLNAVRSTIELRRGRMAAAERSAQTALSMISTQSWGVVIGLPLTSMLLATIAMGKYDEAARYLTVPVPEVMLRTPLGLHYMQARGRYYLATGHSEAALGDFQTCSELMIKWGLDLPTLVPWRADAATALIAMGRKKHARELVEEQLARLAPEHAQIRGVSLRVLAAASDPSERLSLLREAAAILENGDDRLELAYTVAALSRAYHVSGDDDQARMLFARALRLAEECGVPLAVEAATADDGWSVPAEEASATGLIAGLSDAERRVAELAARGHTNRQISSKLFITVSTVEQHLTRVYRKLNVSRRADLPAELLGGTERYEVGRGSGENPRIRAREGHETSTSLSL